MADVRGMYELGRSANTLADTFGNLPEYDIKRNRQNQILDTQQQTANDLQAERGWQTEAAGRDDFGTESYAKDRVKFLQDSGASPMLITKAQLDAQQAAHTGSMQQMTQDYVQKATEDRIAQTLALEYYGKNLQDQEAELVKGGMSAADAHNKMQTAAVTAGRKFMEDQGIVVNVDHTTGNIMAMDKDGHVVPLPSDIAATAYSALGQPAPWKAFAGQQNEALASAKLFGTGAGPVAAAKPKIEENVVAALKALPTAETDYRTLRNTIIKEANTAYNKAIEAGQSKDDAKAAYDGVLERNQQHLDEAKQFRDDLYHAASKTGAVKAAAAAPPPPPAPPIDPATAAAMAAGTPAPRPSNIPAAAQTQQPQQTQQAQSPQALAQTVAQLIQNLHLDRQNLNSPEVQAFLSTIDPQTRAVLEDLLQHINNVQSIGTLPMFNNPRGVPQ